MSRELFTVGVVADAAGCSKQSLHAWLNKDRITPTAVVRAGNGVELPVFDEADKNAAVAFAKTRARVARAYKLKETD